MWDGDPRAPRDWDFYWGVSVQQMPEVTVIASKADAAETNPDDAPDVGTFTFTRTGDLSQSLDAFYTLSGTAVEGTDFQAISGGNGTTHEVSFAPDQSAVTVDVLPVDSGTLDGELTVIATVVDPPASPAATQSYAAAPGNGKQSPPATQLTRTVTIAPDIRLAVQTNVKLLQPHNWSVTIGGSNPQPTEVSFQVARNSGRSARRRAER